MASSHPRRFRASSLSSTTSPRRPSLSTSMHWLSRTASPPPQSSPHPSKSLKISDPKRVPHKHRSGTLGAGAIVVRTPEDALREAHIRLSPEPSGNINHPSSSTSLPRDSLDSRENRSTPQVPPCDSPVTEPVSPPTSPPLPPLPLSDTEEETLVSEGESSSGRKSPRRPNRPPPPLPLGQRLSSRSSIKGRALSSAIEDRPSVPPLPPHVVASTQPPPFHALLVSELPSVVMDPSKTIVTLESCTTTYRTTLSTIQSRPSHLSTYLSSLFHSSDARSTISSRFSAETDDLVVYNQHLTSQGLLPPSVNIHIFLDRPSAPYAHILSYLRSPQIQGQPEVLPRALQIHSSPSTHSRLENLIEVRDEAAFLNLEGLRKLCTDEIRLRCAPRLHSRGNSSSSAASIHSLRASIYSMHTLLERVETDVTNSLSNEHDKSGSLNSDMLESSQEEINAARSLPTPDSGDGRRNQSRRSQGQHRQSGSVIKSPPAGWI